MRKGHRGVLLLVAILVSGCASYGAVKNAPLGDSSPGDSYSLRSRDQGTRSNDLQLTLAFSGGGTRAAAFSYGVLKALREIVVRIEGRRVRLLDEVDAITSVSGGSFTAAYYGIRGEGIFSDFESAFLRRDVEGALLESLLNPLNWFRTTGRTERAIEYYDEHVFRGATFADMRKSNHPLVVINASDLGHGVRFSFLQEYFNLICSDLASFPVARAVAASSAVPVLFSPVVVANHPHCGSTPPEWMDRMRARVAGNAALTQELDGMSSYFDRETRKYVHLVDGGITDNLGLRAMVDLVEAAGGIEAYLRAAERQVPRRMLLIVVNASTDPEPAMDTTNRQPSLTETINAVSDVQLHRYNADTIELTRALIERWGRALATPGRPIQSYFVQLSFRDLAPERRGFFNRIPTSFALNDEQVDKLIGAGAELLRANAEFRRFLADTSR